MEELDPAHAMRALSCKHTSHDQEIVSGSILSSRTRCIVGHACREEVDPRNAQCAESCMHSSDDRRLVVNQVKKSTSAAALEVREATQHP